MFNVSYQSGILFPVFVVDGTANAPRIGGGEGSLAMQRDRGGAGAPPGEASGK